MNASVRPLIFVSASKEIYLSRSGCPLEWTTFPLLLFQRLCIWTLRLAFISPVISDQVDKFIGTINVWVFGDFFCYSFLIFKCFFAQQKAGYWRQLNRLKWPGMFCLFPFEECRSSVRIILGCGGSLDTRCTSTQKVHPC